jgi:hypothetical protein
MDGYGKREVFVDVVRMYAEGIDTAVTAHMTIPQGEYDGNKVPCVTVLMHGLMGDEYTCYVYHTDEYGYARMVVDAPEEYNAWDMYGDQEVTIHPTDDPDYIGRVDVDDLQGFITACRKYMK